MNSLFCKVFIVIIAGLLTSSAYCQQEQQTESQYSLDGTWRSNWELTKKHIDSECKMSSEQIAGFQLLMGKMTVKYAGHKAIVSMPEIRFTKNGKEHVLEGWTSEEKIVVLGRTGKQIAILDHSMSPLDDYAQIINFVDHDTYWVYLGNTPLADSHVREYFTRIRIENQ